jgi:hypothetical protein
MNLKIRSISKWTLRVVFTLVVLAGIFTFIAYWRSTNTID